MTHGINDPPGRLSLQRQRQAGEIARLNQRVAELEREVAILKAQLRVAHDMAEAREANTAKYGVHYE
jgi:uncharacterized coiled-coil protein SlyX